MSQGGEARDQHHAQVVQRGARHAYALHGAPTPSDATSNETPRTVSARVGVVLRPLRATGAAADDVVNRHGVVFFCVSITTETLELVSSFVTSS